jgi:hypothetical protein
MASFAIVLGGTIAAAPLIAMAVEFNPPKRGLPGRREGAGTRDPRACVRGNPGRLYAMLPDTNLGLTTAAYPRFFWYMPETTASKAEFSLHTVDAQQNDETVIYQSNFSVTGKPGVASLAIPTGAAIPPLEIGKDYRWRVSLICDPNNRKSDIKVEGWVSRVVPDGPIAKQLRGADLQTRIKLYANNGYWFDTISTLADLRCAKPQDAALAKSWSTLLKSVRLSTIAEEPIAAICPR